MNEEPDVKCNQSIYPGCKSNCPHFKPHKRNEHCSKSCYPKPVEKSKCIEV
jgi:hypothetical protein